MAFVPDHILDQLRAQLPVEMLLQEHVQFRRAGRTLLGLCPFHNEKTPSFTVRPERGTYKCFGCGASGNIFTFLMEKEGLTFYEAVEEVARRTGVVIPRTSYTPGARQQVEEKERLAKLAVEALGWFRQQLRTSEGRIAQDYIQQRGLTQEIVDQFQLGFAPLSWDGLLNGLGKGNSQRLKDLEKIGLIKPRSSGEGYYDFFRAKLIFPIWDMTGKVVAFGGRKIPGLGDDEGPKYINSPETVLYHKSHTLYGLNFAKDAIREQGRVYVVEGYLDLIGVMQAGLKNAVATLGTSLTEGHVGLLKRFTNRVVFVYDGDRAGQAAMLRGIRVFLPQGMGIRALSLPDNHDPDSFLRDKGKEAFAAIEAAAPDGLDYLLRAEAQGRNLTDSVDRREYVKAIAEYLRAMTSPMERDEVIRRLAAFLRLDPKIVTGEIRLYLPNLSAVAAPTTDKRTQRVQRLNFEEVDPARTLQGKLLWFMFEDTKYAMEIGEVLSPLDFTISEYRRMAELVFRLLAEGKLINENRIIDHLLSDNLLDPYEAIRYRYHLPADHEDLDIQAELQQCVSRLRSLALKRRVAELNVEITDLLKAGEQRRGVELIQERRAVQQQLHGLETDFDFTRPIAESKSTTTAPSPWVDEDGEDREPVDPAWSRFDDDDDNVPF